MIEVYSDREDGYEPFYTPFCDCCGCWLESQYSFGAALKLMKEYDWVSVRNDAGEWENYCDKCVAQHEITARPTASQDFAGLGGSKL